MVIASSSPFLRATVAVTALLFLVKTFSLCSSAFAIDAPAGAHPSVRGPQSVPVAVDHASPAMGPGSDPTAGPERQTAVSSDPTGTGPHEGGDGLDLSIAQELRDERRDLASREAALKVHEAALAATSAMVDRRIAELHALLDRRQAETAEQHARIEDKWMSLVRTYEAMRPTNAAAIFDVLDLHVLIPVLDRMNERRAALVLAAMQPERARLATQQLAQTRVAAISPPGGDAATP